MESIHDELSAVRKILEETQENLKAAKLNAICWQVNAENYLEELQSQKHELTVLREFRDKFDKTLKKYSAEWRGDFGGSVE